MCAGSIAETSCFKDLEDCVLVGVDLVEAGPSADCEVKLFKSNRAAMLAAHGRFAMLAATQFRDGDGDRFVSKLLALRQLSLSRGSTDLAMGRLAMLAALTDVSTVTPRMVIDHGPDGWEWHSFGQGLLPHPECCMVLRDP